MQGEDEILPGRAARHVVRLLGGTVLNRYWDQRHAPRDESYLEDVQTASHSSRPAPEVWRNLRAAAESGWDFSSRWLADGETLATIRTLAILPVDLNCLLVHSSRRCPRPIGRKGTPSGRQRIGVGRGSGLRRSAA